jgi:polyisoprenoid-binding protein YceI
MLRHRFNAHLSAIALIVALGSCSPPAAEKAPEAPQAEAPAPDVTGLPAGAYALDKPHSSLIFRVDHLGMSHFTGRFTDWDASLNLDPAYPGAASFTATIDPKSVATDNAPEGFLATIWGPEFLDAGQFPEMSYRSTAVERTGPNTARITGDFTMHGQTHPLTLEATFNGGYAGHPMDPNARIGFSARGTLNRSDYGIAIGIPAPGTTMGVSDAVEIIIETEFNGPAWTPPPAAQ